jgi:hypothetical protein
LWSGVYEVAPAAAACEFEAAVLLGPQFVLAFQYLQFLKHQCLYLLRI